MRLKLLIIGLLLLLPLTGQAVTTWSQGGTNSIGPYSSSTFIISNGSKFVEGTASMISGWLSPILNYWTDNGTDLVSTSTRGVYTNGLTIPSAVGTYTGTNSPVKWDGHECYFTGFYSAIYWMKANKGGTPDFFYDNGVTTPMPITTLNGSEGTIYVYVTNILGGYLTIYSDMTETELIAALVGTDPSVTIPYYEPAFTNSNGVWTKVMTLPLADNSGLTTWTAPDIHQTSWTLGTGFKIDQNTANITHIGNYVNSATSSYFRTKGSIQVGDGTYIGQVNFPIFVDKIFTTIGTAVDAGLGFIVETKIPDNTTAPMATAGVFGANWYEGNNTNYTGSQFGVYGDLSSLGSGTVQSATGMNTGLANGGGGTRTFDSLVGYLFSFSNRAANGKQILNKLYQFKGGDTNGLTNYFQIETGYGLYMPDMSAYATTSWGVYNLDRTYLGKGVTVLGTATTTNLNLTSLANSYLAVDGAGNIISTTTPLLSFTETDPVWTGVSANYVTFTGATGDLTMGSNYVKSNSGFELLAYNAPLIMGPYQDRAIYSNATGIVINSHWATTTGGVSVLGSLTSDNSITAGLSLIGKSLSLTGVGGTNPVTVASTSGSTLFTVLSNGTVGIGTSTPSVALEVNGDAEGLRRSWNTTSSYGQISFRENLVAKATVQTMGSAYSVATRQNDLELRSVSGDIGLEGFDAGNVLLAGGGGKVSIGNDAPIWPFEVYYAGGANATSSSISLCRSHNDNGYCGSMWLGNDTTNSDYLAFGVKNNGNVFGNEKMRITNAGYMGIGKINPVTMLDVAGTASSTGLRVNGNSTIVGTETITSGSAVGVTVTTSNNTSWIGSINASDQGLTAHAMLGGQIYGNNWVGVAGESNQANGIGVFGSSTNYAFYGTGAGYISGNFSTAGTVSFSGVAGCSSGIKSAAGTGALSCISSDESLKTDIDIMPDVTDDIMSLSPKTYYWVSTTDGTEKNYGLIAQDVEKINPSLTFHFNQDGTDLLGINWQNLTAMILKMVQSLKLDTDRIWSAISASDDRIANLEKENKELKARLQVLESKYEQRTISA